MGVHAGELREGLLATVRRKGKEYVVSALNVEVTVDTEVAMFLAAYRRWAATG